MDEPNESTSVEGPISLEQKDVSNDTERVDKLQDIEGGITDDKERDSINDRSDVTASVDDDAFFEMDHW